MRVCAVRVPAGNGAQGELRQKVASPCEAGPLEPSQQHSDPDANHLQIRGGSVCARFVHYLRLKAHAHTIFHTKKTPDLDGNVL